MVASFGSEPLTSIAGADRHSPLPGAELYAPVQKAVNEGGLMHDDAELMDEIVADAYRQRRGETWRELDL
jgi:hypothetical protein